MDIIITPKVLNKNLVLSHFSGRGWRFIDASPPGHESFRHAWRRATAGGGPTAALNYPIEEAADLDTVEAFLADLACGEPQALYYAPRPNDFVSVAEPALMGVFAVAANRGKAGFLTRLRATLGLPYVAAAAAPPAGAAGHVSPPAALNDWPECWTPWRAPAETLRRDLVTRVARFFARPQGIHVVLLNKCNLKCVMCPYHSPAHRRGHTSGYFDEYRSMSPETFEKVAEYASDLGISLQFGQIEEPLMHKRAIDYIARAKKGMSVPHVHLTTNGTLLTPDKASALAESGVDSVMFSIDALNAATYQAIRGEDLDRLESQIADFLTKARPNGVRVGASFILQQQAIAERDAFLEKWRGRGLDYVTFYALSAQDPATGVLAERREFYDKGGRYPCAAPWSQSVVLPDGQVSLCCKTMNDLGWRGVVSVGDASVAALDDIWTGPHYAQVREELLRNQFEGFPVCADCEIWSAGTVLSEKGPGYVRTYNETLENYTFR